MILYEHKVNVLSKFAVDILYLYIFMYIIYLCIYMILDVILCHLTLSNYLPFFFYFISSCLNCSVGSSDMDLLSSLLWLDIFLSFEISIKAVRVVETMLLILPNDNNAQSLQPSVPL